MRSIFERICSNEKKHIWIYRKNQVLQQGSKTFFDHGLSCLSIKWVLLGYFQFVSKFFGVCVRFYRYISLNSSNYWSYFRNSIRFSIMIGVGAGLIVPLFNIFLRNRLEANDFQIGTLISITQIATSIGCLFTPYLVRYFGQIRTVVISQLSSIPFLLIIGGVPYFSIVSVAYFLRSTLMNMVNPIVASVSMQIVNEDERAAASSIIRAEVWGGALESISVASLW